MTQPPHQKAQQHGCKGFATHAVQNKVAI